MRKNYSLFITTLLLLSLHINTYASELRLKKISNNAYAIIGPLGNRDRKNLGNNCNFGFVVTNKGVFLIDPGGSYLGAKHIHMLIKSVTDKPVKVVINTGGQDHRWLGNGYFKKLGASIIAAKAAVADQKSRQQDQFFMLGNLVGVKGLKNTEPSYATTTFDDSYNGTLGNLKYEIYNFGTAHTPGDSFVWLPEEKIMFSGDIVFVDRMLGIIDASGSKNWINVFEKMAAFKPEIIVPGHGSVTNLEKSRKDTYDYLVYLRKTISEFIELGGGIEDIGKLDQTRFNYLKNFKILKGRNAQKVYQELEWE